MLRRDAPRCGQQCSHEGRLSRLRLMPLFNLSIAACCAGAVPGSVGAERGVGALAHEARLVRQGVDLEDLIALRLGPQVHSHMLQKVSSDTLQTLPALADEARDHSAYSPRSSTRRVLT